MKPRACWLLIPVLALSLGACKKKEVAKAPETPAAATQAPPAAAPVAEPKIPALTPEQRAAKLGFVRHLPQDTEVVLSFHNGTKSAARVQASKLWRTFIGNPMTGGAPAGADPAAGDEPTGPAALFGTEFTLALGKSTAEQTGNLLTFNRRMGYFQMQALAKAFAAAVKSGDASSFGASFGDYGPELFKDLLHDPQSGMALVEKTRMPPVYMAFKTTEANHAAAAQQLAAMVANANLLGEMIEPAAIENAGCKFEGVKILGTKISASMAADRASLDEQLDAATVDQLLAAVAQKDLLLLSGTVGDYVVLFLGSSTADLHLAADLGQSLAASDALAFSDGYVSKELAAVVYGRKQALETLISAAGGLAEMANGLRDGIAGAEGLGDTRDLEAMIKIVAEREAALRQLAVTDALGTVAFFEDGLKIESYGGTDNGMVDWKSPNQLARLGDSEDVVLFANLTADAAYDGKARAYAEALLETAYAMTLKVAEAPIQGKQLEQFQQMAKLFDDKFRPDLLALWDAFGNDFHTSLGHERALVVDLKGSAPAVPGLPQAVVDSAKVPRVSLVAPVTDRAKLAASWDKMNGTLTGTFAKIGEMTGQKIPMQKPLSSEKNGYTTWFFPLPFFNDDFLPSVTVGDKWFAASSSKNQALDLITQADAGGESRDGFFMSVNFKALETYSEQLFKVIDENAAAITGSPLPADRKELIKASIAALGDFDKLTVHSRREAGVLRSSVHLKTR